MATVVVKTVKPSGGDYTSLAAAEAGEQRDLTAVDQICAIECYSMLDSAFVTVAGWTTDATRYVHIYTPLTERSSNRRWDATKYRISSSSFTTAAFKISQQYTRVDGIQVNATNSSAYNFQVAASTPGVQVTNCIAYQAGKQSFDSTTVGTVFDSCVSQSGNGFFRGNFSNCIAVDSTGAGFSNVGFDGVAYYYNCVAVNGATAGFAGDARFGTRFAYCVNCYAGGNTGADYDNTFGFSSLTTCYSEDGTAGTTVAAFSTANFTNVTPGSEDLSLVTGSALIDAGTDLSTDPNWVDPAGFVDIIGTTRPQGAGWDVGAFEYVAAGGGGTRPVAASAAATSAMTASIAVRRRMAASVVTTSVVTASVSRSRRLATAITTTSFVTTSAHVVRSVTASAVSATSSIIVLLSRPLHLTLFATSAITALVGRTRHASISISATSFMAAEFVRLRSTGTDVAATSDVAASIDVKGLALIVVNAVSATSSLTAHFVRRRSLVASVVGISPVTATFGKKGAVPLVVAVNAVTSGLTASLARRLRFDASAMATSAVTVSLARTRRLSASVAATSTVTAYAGAQRHLFASAVATSDVAVDLARHKFLEASVVATSFVTSPGFIVVSIGGNFVIATSLRAGRLLGADDLAPGSVGFGTGQPGRIFAGGI